MEEDMPFCVNLHLFSCYLSLETNNKKTLSLKSISYHHFCSVQQIFTILTCFNLDVVNMLFRLYFIQDRKIKRAIGWTVSTNDCFGSPFVYQLNLFTMLCRNLPRTSQVVYMVIVIRILSNGLRLPLDETERITVTDTPAVPEPVGTRPNTADANRLWCGAAKSFALHKSPRLNCLLLYYYYYTSSGCRTRRAYKAHKHSAKSRARDRHIKVLMAEWIAEKKRQTFGNRLLRTKWNSQHYTTPRHSHIRRRFQSSRWFITINSCCLMSEYRCGVLVSPNRGGGDHIRGANKSHAESTWTNGT